MKIKKIISAAVIFIEIFSLKANLSFGQEKNVNLTIIKREEWGANEDLTYLKNLNKNTEEGKNNIGEEINEELNSKTTKEEIVNTMPIKKIIKNDPETEEELIWPITYPEQIKKIVIHHSGTTKDLDNPVLAIKNIYYFHAVKRGWGDIGYNFLIDKFGNIYEGRKGGEDVAGGHVYGFNRGTIGIAMLGNFENELPSYEALRSLILLSNSLSRKFSLNPNEVSEFNGKITFNLLGHSDLAATSCPGKSLKNYLPEIRKIVSSSSENFEGIQGQEYDFLETEDTSILSLEGAEERIITFRLKNSGTKPWDKKTFLVLNQNEKNQGHVEIVNKDKYSFLEETSVEPNEIGTFKIKIKTGLKGGFLSLNFTPIYNGEIKRSHNITLPVYIKKADFSFSETKIFLDKNKYEENEIIKGNLLVKNSGKIIWTKKGKNEVKLIFGNPLWKKSPLLPDENLVIAELAEDEVAPGNSANFNFQLKAKGQGLIKEKFILYNDEFGSLKGEIPLLSFNIGANGINADLSYISDGESMSPEEEKVIEFKLKNLSGKTWERGDKNKFVVVVIGEEKIKFPSELTFMENEVIHGNEASFNLKIKAPKQAGNYFLILVPWNEGKKILAEQIYYRFSVTQNSFTNYESEIEKPMRIKLSFEDNKSPEITGSAKFILIEGKETIKEFEPFTKVKISEKDNKYFIDFNEETIELKTPPRFVSQKGGYLLVSNMEKRPEWNKEINDIVFRGILEVRNYKEKLIVINELSLEDYVRGIGEVPSGEPIEKIKAMMVIARTYAKYYRDIAKKFPDAPFHLDDDPKSCQKYLGYNFELRAADVVSAALLTADEIVTYQGKLIKTPYFNSSDGRTRSAKEVWGWEDTPYLKSVQDPLCSKRGSKLNGHGVGLSGCGAAEAAKLGKTYIEIIKYYYSGVEIEKQ